mgnify:CR=1 FL=1
MTRLITLVFLFSINFISAQMVEDFVLDEDSNPIPFAKVWVKNYDNLGVVTSQNKVYWNLGNTYTYEATYLSKDGDTLSSELVNVCATDSIFNYNQTLLNYSYSLKNSHLKPKMDSILGFNKEWTAKIGEGALEGDRLWTHPFRSNQYVLTEIAPFPRVYFPLTLNSEVKSVTKIFKSFGNFKGTVKSTLKVISKEERTYSWGVENNCWKIESVGKHSKLGKSYLTVYFKEGIGFLEMNYTFYNGEKINFKLLESKK